MTPLRIIQPVTPMRVIAWIAFLTTALHLTACYEPREGCLDIEAVNFDAAADKHCCCTYPSLRLRYSPQFDTLVWKPDTAYEYAPGRWFRIQQAVFYLSDFQFVQNGQAHTVTDTVGLAVLRPNGDTVREVFTNDFLVLRRTVANYTIGEFRPSGLFQSARWRVGVPDAAQHILPSSAPQSHPLSPQPEGLWLGDDSGFAAMRLIITRDTLLTTPPDTLVFAKPDFPSKTLESSGPFLHESGYDFGLQLRVDFRELFRGVDLSTGDTGTWKARIWANLDSAISVLPE